MKRLPLILLALVALAALGVFSSIVTHGFEELAKAEGERDRLEQRKIELSNSIEEYEETLEAIRTDPAAVESLARGELGMVRPGDTVILLATPTPPPKPALTGPTPTPILALPK
ncbi:MAG: septum formation initiator family protein [Acidobacteriota bacterium]|nr:septum formation initiator family protein [Acidobacteriota bacterium]